MSRSHASVPKRRRYISASLSTVAVETMREWINDNVSRLGAALAFYSVLSIGPALLIVIYVAGLFFGQDAASGYVFTEIRGLVGDDSAQMIQAILVQSRYEDSGFWATLISVVVLLLTATRAVGELQDALNIIWKVKASPGVLYLIRKRFFTYVMLLGIAFLLLLSLVLEAVISALGNFTAELPEVMMRSVNILLSFGLTSILFAMIFKILPDARIRWREVWLGALLTSMLFTLGKFAIGLYLGRSAFSSTYGAAGSLMVVLIWIYYSAQILFLGAEFTQVYAKYRIPEEEPEKV